MKYMIFMFLVCFNLTFATNIEPELQVDDPTMKGMIALMGNDYEEAAYWFAFGVEQGDADAQFMLGSFYNNGQGVSRDSQRALELYKLSAKQGNAKAQFNLGVHYGKETSLTSKNESKKWYKLAAAQGVPEAQFALGYLYDEEGNELDAFHWYKLSADQGNANSQANLGVYYVTGKAGLSVDYFKGVEYFQLSADQGDVSGQVNLGFAYELGLGVRQNYDSAKYWYGKACDNRSQEGCERYRDINK